MFNFSNFIPIYTHLYDHIIFLVGKSTLNMSVKVKIRVRRKVTVVNQKKMVAIERDIQKLYLMVRFWLFLLSHDLICPIYLSQYAILTRVGMSDGL